MNRAVAFLPYPLASAPAYSRWLAWGLAALVVVSGGAVFLRSSIEPRLAVAAIVGTLLLWGLALMIRVLGYRFNRHNAQCYADATEQVRQAWWMRHRQKIALVESVLVSAACNKPEQVHMLFGPDHQPPTPQETGKGRAIRLLQVLASDAGARERELAVMLALQWQAQSTERCALEPVCCYWQGTQTAWQAFVEQMAACCEQVRLPEHPEPWQGIRSLDTIIDRLQGAPAGARVLCAGCHSSPTEPDSRLPAGEAAVLWLLGRQGGVRFSRGEWFSAEDEQLATVAERALQQSELEGPTTVCVSFSQPHVDDLAVTGWNTRQNVQDANFGALANLEAMVAQTLAAWHTEQHGGPCAWLASDPHYTLALGVVEADDSSS